MTAFFVPTWVDGDSRSDEERYSDLAKSFRGAGCVPLEPHERIESITWMHDGEEWTATVGQRLRGRKPRQVKRNGRKVDTYEPLSDGATVLAIMVGQSTMVITNRGLVPGVSSAWHNPLMAGDRLKVTRFDPPSEGEPTEATNSSD